VPEPQPIDQIAPSEDRAIEHEEVALEVIIAGRDEPSERPIGPDRALLDHEAIGRRATFGRLERDFIGHSGRNPSVDRLACARLEIVAAREASDRDAPDERSLSQTKRHSVGLLEDCGLAAGVPLGTGKISCHTGGRVQCAPMASLTGRVMRELYRREALPARVRWWLAALGMIDFIRVLARGLEPKLADRARPIVSDLVARMFERRSLVLRATYESWPGDDRAKALALAGLYRMAYKPENRSSWFLEVLGGAPRSRLERFRAVAIAHSIPSEDRWREVTVHLGELLIVTTEELPKQLPGARKILGDICFEMGARYADRTKRLFGISSGDLSPERAIEILRMSEYVFRVNPEHWSAVDHASGTGSLEGTACPWYSRPGWEAGHCGIFGQFQAGISASFGLKYRLSQTIPKHGGHTCKIDLVPLPSKRSAHPVEPASIIRPDTPL
jgi:hypothetical protein